MELRQIEELLKFFVKCVKGYMEEVMNAVLAFSKVNFSLAAGQITDGRSDCHLFT